MSPTELLAAAVAVAVAALIALKLWEARRAAAAAPAEAERQALQDEYTRTMIRAYQTRTALDALYAERERKKADAGFE